jgi:hypothetical protein
MSYGLDLHICLPVYGSTNLLLDLERFFSFLILYTGGRTPWTGDQLVARPLPKHRTTQTQNKCTQTSVPQVGLEPTIPVLVSILLHIRPVPGMLIHKRIAVLSFRKTSLFIKKTDLHDGVLK